ncbi:LacI family DNA-binding transcriptional regulator [Streptomyces globisporus]|uniref:LacI family DNA-binding transcriptional regulator n=1 Tax=Streptomyces globisporus TaxID=1908 RepID=UPI00367420AD
MTTSSKDVAARAGVSRSTVSQVLNGHEDRFSPETVARVKEAAEGLGYRPSTAARTLARGTSDIVITLVPNITFGPRLRDFLDVLSSGLEREGYVNLLRLATARDPIEDAVLGLRPYAVVSLAPLEESDRRRLQRHGALVVEHSRAAQEHLDTAIGQRQAEHLAACGYRTIAAAVAVDAREHRFASPRAGGVHEWSLRNGLHVLPTLYVDLTHEGPAGAVAQLPEVPLGIAAYNDEVALAVLGAAQQLGRSIPDDVGIIGVDNSPLARIATPAITSIDFDIEFSARSMLRAILDHDSRFQDADAAEVERRLRVVSGRSTPPPAQV